MMDFCNNYSNYRGPPGAPNGYHHHSIHPAAMRYHHGMPPSGQSLYHRGAPVSYYGNGYYDGYQPPAAYQYPNYHHFSSYTNLREGFGGSYNSQYANYNNNHYYGGAPPAPSPAGVPSPAAVAAAAYNDYRPYQYREHHHAFYDNGYSSIAAKGLIDLPPSSKNYFPPQSRPFHHDRLADTGTPTSISNQQVTSNNNNNNSIPSANDSTSTTPNSTGKFG